ncbi:thioredoxin reductase [Annulohypoxylon moriforme]|nr:thioredoxin reductase [Annulohypoxylon moriforme]
MGLQDELYDVIIIGGSYAGLSAALTLYRATHTCLIFDSGDPRNALSTQTRLTSGWENEEPQKLREASRTELQNSGLVQFVSRTVRSTSKNQDGTFDVVDEEQAIWKGRKILLATGVKETYPDIEGYAENYGTSIYYCMFCFGYELRGSSTAGLLAIGVLANPMHALTNARDAQKFVDSVTIYTDGNPSLAGELSGKLDEGMRIDDRKIRRLHKSQDDKGIHIELNDGEKVALAFIVHKPDLQVDTTLPAQLGCECVPGFGIKVNPPFNSTSVDGVFAAGDCCSPLRMIPNAMSMGSFAGCGLARELPRRKHEGPKDVPVQKRSDGLVGQQAMVES